MNFRIGATFTDSPARLTGDEQKAFKTTAFDLQMNPANPGMQFHKLDKARDKNFGSVRVSRDARLIASRTPHACCASDTAATTLRTTSLTEITEFIRRR